MDDDSFLERKVEKFWGMRPGQSRDMPNWLFLDSREYMEIQFEADHLSAAALKDK